MAFTINDMSKGLKDYLNAYGVSEERVIELINESIPDYITDITGKIEAIDLEQRVQDNRIAINANNIYEMKRDMVSVMLHLNFSTDVEITDAGYWYDGLTDATYIEYIETLVLDMDRHRIYGDEGNVIFKDLNIPFACNELSISVDMDRNFVESVSYVNAGIGESIIQIDTYTYKVD